MSSLTLRGVDAKDPTEQKLYTMNWEPYLNDGATISTSTWVVVGVAKVSDSIVTGNVKTSILVSGGSEGQAARVTNTIVTSDSETLVRSGEIPIWPL